MTKPKRRIAGVDASLKSTGVALADGTFATIAPASSIKAYERHLYIWRHLDVILYEHEIDFVALEDYAPNSLGRNSLIRGAELQGRIRAELTDRAIPFATIRPNTLKLFATGKGNAKKAEVFDAARAAIASKPRPANIDVDFADVANYDEADAYFAREYALAIYERRLELPAKGVDWPIEEVPLP